MKFEISKDNELILMQEVQDHLPNFKLLLTVKEAIELADFLKQHGYFNNSCPSCGCTELLCGYPKECCTKK